MTVPDIIFLVLVLCLAFIIRVLPSLKTRGIGNDPHFYLLAAREIKEKRKIPEKIDQLIGPDYNTKPPLLSIVLSFFLRVFSSSNILKYFNPFLDCLNIVLIYIFISEFASGTIALFTCVFYAFTPILVQSANTLIPRPLAIFLFNITVFSLWKAFVESNFVFFGLCVLSLSLLLITHRSSVQISLGVLFFLSIFYLGSSFPFYILGSILLGIAVNVLVNRRRFILMVREHLKFVFDYPTGPLELQRILANPPIMGGLFFVMISLIGILVEIGVAKIVLLVPSLSPFIWFFILQLVGALLFYALDFWGRYSGAYFPFVAIPSCFLTAVLIIEWVNEPFNYILFALILSVSLFFCLRNNAAVKKNTLRITNPLLSLFEFIESENGSRILCLPSDYCHPIAYYTRQKVLYGGEFASIAWFRENLDPILPELNKGNIEPLKAAIQKFSITHIFIDSRKIQSHFIRDLACKLVIKKEEYELYDVRPYFSR
jgi:hypothetical protein